MFGRKGSTLVEILFVLIIAAGIMLYAVPSYKRTQERSRYEAALGTLISVGNGVQALEQYLQADGYTFTFPPANAGTSYNIAGKGPGSFSIGSNASATATPKDIIEAGSSGNNKRDRFLFFLFTMKYVDVVPAAAQSGYEIYAINTSNGTPSVCSSKCGGTNNGSPVMACMCQTNVSSATGCFYGAKMYRNGNVEKFTKGSAKCK